MENNIRLKAIGHAEAFPDDVQKELAETMRLTRENRGMIFPIANLYFSSFSFNGYGAPAFPKKNGKYNWHTIGFNSANGVKALTFLGNLAKQNVVPKDADYGPMDSNFTAGKVGFAINGPWAFPAWSKALGSKMGVANIPKLPNGKERKCSHKSQKDDSQTSADQQNISDSVTHELAILLTFTFIDWHCAVSLEEERRIGKLCGCEQRLTEKQ